MNVSGSKADVWRVPTTINTPPLSEGQPSTSPLSFCKVPEPWSSAPPDLVAPTPSQDFIHFPFPPPELYNLGLASTATSAVTRFLLAQIGAAALSTLAQTTATNTTTTTTTNNAPSSTGEPSGGRNNFSIADHISEDVKEGKKDSNDDASQRNDDATRECHQLDYFLAFLYLFFPHKNNAI